MHSISPPEGGRISWSTAVDIPHPCAMGKNIIVGLLDNIEVEGQGVTARGHVPQDRLAYFGSPPPKAPLVLLPDSAQFGGLWRQTIVNGASVHHRRDSGNCRKTTVRVSRARWGGFNNPTTLPDTVWSGESGSQAYCWGVRVLNGQQSPTLGGLQGTDVRVPHWHQQVPWSKASRSGWVLVLDAG